MEIDKTLVKKIAALAKLDFNEQEIEAFTEQFSEIVGFVEKLTEIDTGEIEVADIHGRPDNSLFTDKVENWLSRKEALANAPESDEEFFLVPKVISDEQ